MTERKYSKEFMTDLASTSTSYDEMAERMNLTRGRIRQILVKWNIVDEIKQILASNRKRE